QANLQHVNRTTGRLDWHSIDAEAGCGFEALPPPSAGDLFFDIEGDPFWQPARGLHFLFGLLLRDGADWRYEARWAHDRAGERRLFEDLVDLVHERLARDPGMHVYHYGAYEKTAITELMGVYATREEQVVVTGSEPGTPRWLAGELLEYHRREARPAWWWFFQRRDHMTVEELVDDAESIGRLTPIGRPRPDRNSLLHTLAFPIQQHKL